MFHSQSTDKGYNIYKTADGGAVHDTDFRKAKGKQQEHKTKLAVMKNLEKQKENNRNIKLTVMKNLEKQKENNRNIKQNLQS